MSYDDIVKEILSGEKIYNLPLRVTYYCRVSTDSDVQLNSLDSQLDYYTKLIKSKPNWIFVEGYVEEGVTGVRVDKRTSFKRMIRDAKLNKFDLIITKEVSRFARDLEDSIHYIRELKTCGVGVFFENQNLNTFDDNSELVLNIMFNLAQDESKKLSSRVKFGHKRAIEKGHVLGSNNITGYKKEKCKLIIIENEAEFIKKVFNFYVTGEYGLHKLAIKLGELGYYNKKGKIYDKDTLKRIIKNPKYKGYYRGHTYEIMDYRTKKRKAIPKEEQVIYKCKDGSIPAIVSEEVWSKANELLDTRTKSYKNNNYWSGGLKYPFSSKIYCKEHNTNFQRSHGSRSKNRPTWSCGMYMQHRLKACLSPIIAEKDLYNILNHIMNKLIPCKNKIIEDVLNIYRNVDKKNRYDEELDEIDEEIKIIEDKKMMALDLIFNGELSKNQLKIQFEKYENDKRKLIIQKESLNRMKLINENQDNIDEMYKLFEKEIDEGILEDFIRKFVDEIIISKTEGDRHNIKLEIYLNMLGVEKTQTKGARHINQPRDEDLTYIENEKICTIEKLKSNCKKNNFTYSVFIEAP